MAWRRSAAALAQRSDARWLPDFKSRQGRPEATLPEGVRRQKQGRRAETARANADRSADAAVPNLSSPKPPPTHPGDNPLDIYQQETGRCLDPQMSRLVLSDVDDPARWRQTLKHWFAD